jgi:ATP-dependent DNA helicase RecQ
VPYHGDLLPQEKIENLNKWKSDIVKIVVATKSLGMGIDKSDVRSVIHVSVPNSIPEYHQQVGRAGRDGEQAICHLFFKFSDRAIHMNHIKKMDDHVQTRNALVQLQVILKLFMSPDCLTAGILRHFGELDNENYRCNQCFKCETKGVVVDVSKEAKHILLVLQGLIPQVKNVPIS